MSVQLKPDSQHYVDEQLKAGRYGSAEDVVEAALATLRQQEAFGDFAPGELEGLIAVGLAQLERGEFHDGETVFRELDEMAAIRRREQSR